MKRKGIAAAVLVALAALALSIALVSGAGAEESSKPAASHAGMKKVVACQTTQAQKDYLKSQNYSEQAWDKIAKDVCDTTWQPVEAPAPGSDGAAEAPNGNADTPWSLRP